MKSFFYMQFNIKTSTGSECYGKVFIGHDYDFAHSLFGKMKGREDVNEKSILNIDFIESRNGLPVNINMIRCTLNEAQENFGIITREIFKYHNLNGA